MSAQYKLRAFTLLAATVLLAAEASAFCSSCGTAPVAYSAGYAAPVAYQAAYAPAYTTAYAPAYTTAYAPAYTTAYAPAYTTTSSGWYPGYWLGRVNRSIWGAPTTTYYAPAYTAAYAPTYTAAYATTAYYAPACSSCNTCSNCTASYAPACSTCSACSASYAPACSACSTCDACAASGSSCPSCDAGAVSQATYTETVAAPATTTYVPQTTTNAAPITEHQPTLAPNENVAPERSIQETQKPVPADPPLQPEPQADSTDDSATNLQAPKLFDPNDRTAARHMAPVWTAVYHKLSGAEPSVQPVSWQQAERDAEGWTSASE